MSTIPNYEGYDLEIIKGAGGSAFIKVYNNSGGALSNGAIKVVAYLGTSGEIIAIPIAPAVNTDCVNIIGVVNNTLMGGQATIPNAEFGFLQIAGKVDALVDGTGDVAVGVGLEVIDEGTAFVVSGQAAGGVSKEETAAIALEAYTTDSAALKAVWLLGKMSTVEAS